MPTYDYKCLKCFHKFSVLVSLKEKDNVRCPVCQSDQISQIYSGAGVAVKTGGESGESCNECGSKFGFG